VKSAMAGQIKSFFLLIRFPNLLIIAATQYAMRHLIMEPLLPNEAFSLQMDGFHFFLLVLATVFIAAAGYIINDYFDTRADMINKPSRVVVGVEIGRRTAMILHATLNILGVGIGIYLGFHISLPALSLLFMLATGLLWFYSTNYKRQFLVGNLSVALLTGLVPLMVVLFEIPLLNRVYGQEMLRNQVNFNYMFAWVGGFGFFAFLTTFIREVIKDAEDFEGDAAYGMHTFPIVAGIKWTRVFLIVLVAFTLATLIYLLLKFILFSVEPADYISLVYFILFLFLPLIALGVLVSLARNRRDFHSASTLVKLIMLSGIMYAVVVYYLVKFRY